MNTEGANQWSSFLTAGRQAFEANNMDAAEKYFLAALDSAQEQQLDQECFADTISHLAFVKEDQGDYTSAAQLYQESLNLLPQSPGQNNPKVEQLRTRLAFVSKALAGQSAQVAQVPNNGHSGHSAIHQPPKTNQNLAENFQQGHFICRNIEPIKSLVTTRENVYGTISVTIGIFAYALALLCGIGLFLGPLLLLITCISHGYYIGGLRSNSIRISKEQLPELNALLEEICAIMGMPIPTVYVSNGEGMLNAFATRLLSRDFVVIYSNILELAYEKGEAEVTFVLAHELGHIKRRHTKFRFLHYPASLIPFLGTAYSRACETTCDRIAAAICPSGAPWGLVALAAGSKIYRRISLDALFHQIDEEHGFWTWFHEILSTHPNLVKRIRYTASSLPNKTTFDSPAPKNGSSSNTRFSRLRG